MLGEWAGLVTQLGVSGVLLICWYLEYQRSKEEREYNKTLIEEHNNFNQVLLERVLRGLHDAEAAIRAGVEGHTATTSTLSSLRDLIIAKGRNARD